MAVPTGSGTETLHSHMYEDVDAAQNLIVGVQHHVYTVLSVIVYCEVLNATADFGFLRMIGYDNHGGASAQEIFIAKFNIQVGETYVWNDKFSFNGYEPTGTDVMSTAAHATANAAQAGGTAQLFQFSQSSTVDDFNVVITYLDQDWT
jgi:hypothetical protein